MIKMMRTLFNVAIARSFNLLGRNTVKKRILNNIQKKKIEEKHK